VDKTRYCCNECEKEFTIRKIDESRVQDDVERTFFVCPYCKREYTVCYTDVVLRNEQRDVRILYERAGKTKDEKKRLELKERIQKKQVVMKKRMDELLEQFEPSKKDSNS